MQRQPFEAAPNEASTHFMLGEAYISLNRYKEAVASLRRAVELDPNKDYYSSALSRASVYLHKAETEDY